ncbi:uncharacterized protein [Heptranchias perlo]|uniref:uncharacterized protein isoform X1 n=1 Tax=Heptranchias perlo TaxID=212740 RepID=UPI003559D65C
MASGKLKGGRFPGASNAEGGSETSRSVRRPESVANLGEYEGTMVGMDVSAGSHGPKGMAEALTRGSGSEGLAGTMLGMQKDFMEEIGIREGASDAKSPPSQANSTPGWRQHCGSKWNKLALAVLAICAICSIAMLILYFQGSEMERKLKGEKYVLETLEGKYKKTKELLSDNVAALKCTRYEEMFLEWLKSFCNYVNCTSELCHKYWTPYEGNCYYFSRTVLGWEESRQDCISQGSDLLVIRSRREQRFAAAFDVQKIFWIGIREIPDKSPWMWVDRTHLQPELTFWDRDSSGQLLRLRPRSVQELRHAPQRSLGQCRVQQGELLDLQTEVGEAAHRPLRGVPGGPGSEGARRADQVRLRFSWRLCFLFSCVWTGTLGGEGRRDEARSDTDL